MGLKVNTNVNSLLILNNMDTTNNRGVPIPSAPFVRSENQFGER